MKKKLKWIGIILAIIIGFSIYIIASEVTSGKKQLDEQYIEMHEIDINNSLLGLSEEEIVELLGKPVKIYTYNDKEYMYNAGHIYEGLIFGHRNFWTTKHNYVLYISFDETDKVKSTTIQERP